MKRLTLWAIALVFLISVDQSVAGPPVKAPPGSIGFTTETLIDVEGTVSTSERYTWQYTEGEGNFLAPTSGTDDCGHAVLTGSGFLKGASIAYQQNYSAVNGSTYFYRRTVLDPEKAPNLSVRSVINFSGDPFTGSALATFNETVGLTVISSGAEGSPTTTNRGSGLLSLCPWAGAAGGQGDGGYPATSEAIAAGSSFTVTNIHGFISQATVISTEAPFLGYSVTNLSGEGFISAGFTAEIWEGVTRWGSHDIGIHKNPATTTGIYAMDDPPQEASRASYSDLATANGIWTFRKSVSYQTPSKRDPFFQVP